MPDILGPFERQLLLETRKMLVLGLAEAPRAFIIELVGFPSFTVVAHSGSFGLYPGTMLNAAVWFPPLPDIELKGLTLPNGDVPTPNMMLMRDGFKRAIEDLDKALATED